MGLGFSCGCRLSVVYRLGGDGFVSLVEDAAYAQMGLGRDRSRFPILYRDLHSALENWIRGSYQGRARRPGEPRWFVYTVSILVICVHSVLFPLGLMLCSPLRAKTIASALVAADLRGSLLSA